MNPCKIIYAAAGQPEKSGKSGICRITGLPGVGISFNAWVKDTFNNHDLLYPGDIISHEALFCFDEASELLQKKTGRDKPQRFRTYSHIVTQAGDWFCLTKADKEKIVSLIKDTPLSLLCLTDSGQKHVLFKNRPPVWQLDDLHIMPDIQDFFYLHEMMMQLLKLGFSQSEIKSGDYSHARILKAGFSVWQEFENKLSARRGEPIFDFAAWLMFTDKNSVNE